MKDVELRERVEEAPMQTYKRPPAPDVRLMSEKEEELPMVQFVPVTDTRGTLFTFIVLNVTEVSESAPAEVVIKDGVRAVIPVEPVNEMSSRARVPADALVMK